MADEEWGEAARRNRPDRRRRRRPPADLTSRLASSSLIFVGLLIGLAAGLYYAWVASPVVFTEALPARLRDDIKTDYIFLVSQSFAADGDLQRAQTRLAALDEPDMDAIILDELARYLREGKTASDVRHMAQLAEALGLEGAPVAIFAPTAVVVVTETPAGSAPTATSTLLPTPTETRPPTGTPTATRTPFPTITPTPTTRLIYRILSQERVCDPSGPVDVIEIEVLDALLDPLAGVEVRVDWDGGSDTFFTGFKPERSAGFADFTMSPDTSYQITLPEGSPVVSGMRLETCPDGQLGGWRLTFQNLVVGIPEPDDDE